MLKKYLLNTFFIIISPRIFSDQCYVYVKFNHVESGYTVTHASNSLIDSSNVLSFNVSSNGKVDDELSLPNQNNKDCFPRDYSVNPCKDLGKICYGIDYDKAKLNCNNIFSSGDFTPKNSNARGNILLAQKSGYLSDDNVKNAIINCKNSYENELKEKQIQQKLREENAKRLKEEDIKRYNKYVTNEKIYEEKFRQNIKQGTQTNCGTVIENKGIMYFVQTGSDAGAIWIKKNYLNPLKDVDGNYIQCSDDNRLYKNSNGSWVLQAR